MDDARRNRVKRIKRFILVSIAVAILLPVLGCVLLGVKLHKVQKQLSDAYLTIENQQKQLGDIYTDLESSHDFESESMQEADLSTTDAMQEMSVFDHSVLENQETPEAGADYRIYLTFDDGPSENTEEILTILREYGVKATFFVNGKSDEESLDMYKRIVDAGHTLGMHSYSHNYQRLYASQDSFEQDFDKLRRLIIDKTGVVPIYYRFPGGSSNSVASRSEMQGYIQFLHEQGVEYIDWNIDSGDAKGASGNAESIVNNVFKNFGKYHTNVVLMHDGTGHKATAEALKTIIERARNMGAELLPITEDTVPIQH